MQTENEAFLSTGGVRAKVKPSDVRKQEVKTASLRSSL